MNRSEITENYGYAREGCRSVKCNQQWVGTQLWQEQVFYFAGIEEREKYLGNNIIERISLLILHNARLILSTSRKYDKESRIELRYSAKESTGSVNLESDICGALVSREVYYPFGGTALWATSKQLLNGYKTHRYSGKERDATGLIYFGYRYYAPWLMRWLNPDPAATIDGLNMTRMVRNNPATFADPEGLSPGNSSQDHTNKPGIIIKGLALAASVMMLKIASPVLSLPIENNRGVDIDHIESHIKEHKIYEGIFNLNRRHKGLPYTPIDLGVTRNYSMAKRAELLIAEKLSKNGYGPGRKKRSPEDYPDEPATNLLRGEVRGELHDLLRSASKDIDDINSETGRVKNSLLSSADGHCPELQERLLELDKMNLVAQDLLMLHDEPELEQRVYQMNIDELNSLRQDVSNMQHIRKQWANFLARRN